MISKAAIPEFHALLVNDLREDHFDPHWHFHPEYQLFVVLEGTGTRFVGDQVQRFGPGDLVLTGPNLPHLWRSDDAYFCRESGLRTHGIVVYFRSVILSDALLATQEALRIRQLLHMAGRGLSFSGTLAQNVTNHLKRLVAAHGFDRILGLMEILHGLSLSEDYQILSRSAFTDAPKPADRERMERIITYLMGHFTEPVRLDMLAGIASMTRTAFCRYFRERTNKTLSQFVAELRIGYARKLLVEEQYNISQVGYECGYRTLSNFNRQFKAIAGLTPREYRRRFTDVLVST